MKTFVLLHGAYHGAWCWERVARLLRAAGHQVFTPTYTGVGERAHLLSKDITLDVIVNDVVEALESHDLHDVILVGHSFGGIGITGAADRVPQRIRHLVYLDALILQDGQSGFSVVPPEIAAWRRQRAQDFSNGLAIPPPDPSSFGVTDPADAAWIKKNCTPHPLSTYEDIFRLNGPVGNGLPATYIAVKPEYPSLVAVRNYVKARDDWRYVEMDAGHDAMVTSAPALTEILLAI